MIIGAELAARGAPDGYTLFVASQTTFAIVPNLNAESSTPQQLAARIKNELERFGKLIKTIGLKDE